MKQFFHSQIFLLSLLLISSYSTTASRLLIPKLGDDTVIPNGFTQTGPMLEIEQESSWNLMGMEDCEKGDEECLKRRMISEAHLDYIYTQHHKP